MGKGTPSVLDSGGPLRPGNVHSCLTRRQVAALISAPTPHRRPQRAPVDTVRAIKPTTRATLAGRREQRSPTGLRPRGQPAAVARCVPGRPEAIKPLATYRR